jgi:hypothetical protein
VVKGWFTMQLLKATFHALNESVGQSVGSQHLFQTFYIHISAA